MHARLTKLKGDPGRMDEATQSYRDALSQFAAIDGNRGAFLLVDRDSGVGIGITLWEDADSMTAARERAKELREGAAAQVSAQVESVEEYEVAVWEPQS